MGLLQLLHFCPIRDSFKGQFAKKSCLWLTQGSQNRLPLEPTPAQYSLFPSLLRQVSHLHHIWKGPLPSSFLPLLSFMHIPLTIPLTSLIQFYCTFIGDLNLTPSMFFFFLFLCNWNIWFQTLRVSCQPKIKFCLLPLISCVTLRNRLSL